MLVFFAAVSGSGGGGGGSLESRNDGRRMGVVPAVLAVLDDVPAEVEMAGRKGVSSSAMTREQQDGLSACLVVMDPKHIVNARLCTRESRCRSEGKDEARRMIV